MLPARQLPRGSFIFDDGASISIRGLSRAEAIQLRGMGEDVARIEIVCIAASTGATEEEATAWLNSTPSKEVERLFDAIIALSGLDTDSGKDDAEHLRSVNGTESITSSLKTSENH